jgi:hypothetical protein
VNSRAPLGLPFVHKRRNAHPGRVNALVRSVQKSAPKVPAYEHLHDRPGLHVHASTCSQEALAGWCMRFGRAGLTDEI